MRSFSKKLAFALAAAMVLVTAAPAAQAKAADDFSLNRTAQTLYVNKGVNDKGVVEGLTGNVQKYDFNLKNKPADWKDYGYKWSSSNEKVAKVVSGGVTTAVGVGEATITCVITDKATGKTASTLTAKVTVKANAKDVVISNAAAVDGQVVDLENNVVDLNRTLVDENGNKSATKGKYVTDLTMWVAEPSEGVEINQSNGKFTFTEAAAAGEYKLYCYTYQSTKYTQATATAEPVVVEFVKSNAFDVQQNSVKKFTVYFDNAVEALATSDVTVDRVRLVNDKEYTYKQVVKTVKLAEDKKSATVEMFTAFADATNYVIAIDGFEESFTMTASAGKPVDLVMSSGHSLGDDVVTTGEATKINCTFFDANGIDVTDGTESVIFRLEKYATDGSYYLAGNSLTIKKEGVEVSVKAEYQGYMDSTNKRVGQFSRTATFFALDATPIVVADVADFSLDNSKWDGNAVKSLQVKDKANKTLYVKVLKSDGKKTDGITAGQTILGTTTLSFEAINPDVCAITSDGKLVPNKAGDASFYVNTVTPVTNGAPVVAPFAVVTVKVMENSKLDRIEMNTPSITVGNSALYNDSTVKVTAYDQHGAKYADYGTVKVECLDTTKTVPAGTFDIAATGAERAIKFDGSAMATILGLKAGEAGALEFKVSVDGKEAYFTVVVQTNGDTKADYVEIVASTTYVDAARNSNDANTKATKKVEFEVFTMNNGVKVSEKQIAAYPANGDANAVSAGAYVFKVTKDGNALAVDNNLVKFNGLNKLTVNLSGLAEIKDGAVTGSSVDYSKTGAGVYVFELYQCVESNGVKILVQEQNSACTVVVENTGAYYIAGDQKADTVKAVTKADILDCFTIKDRAGNEVKSTSGKNYAVNSVYYETTGSVYVESITFYEEVATGEYAAYKVTIDTALKVK